MMLGGFKSKLAKHGENLEKVMSGLFFFEGVGSTLSMEIKSFVKLTRLIKVSCFKPSDSLFFPAQRYNPTCLINFC